MAGHEDPQPRDQVERLRVFRACHPDITVKPPAKPGGLWSAHRDGMVMVAERELRTLLDRLDWLVSQP